MSQRLAADAIGVTGLFGKIPSQGDFVTRRLPGDFVRPWDTWLQESIAHGRAALATDWERLYQEAPVWRFLIAPGTCGDSAWAGLFQPSVDRVGRYFPLTVAAALPSDLDVLQTMNAARRWYDAIERAASAAFENAVQLESLEANLVAAGFPPAGLVAEGAAEDTLPLAERPVTALAIAAGSDGSLQAAAGLLREQQVNVGHTYCVWFNASSDPPERVLLVTKGLPQGQLAIAFLDGRWALHGWDTGPSDMRLSA
jgi:type VI secretion system protein ImpM